jgi:hypothetical protein
MRIHALEATGGQPYSQMGRFLDAKGNPTSDETKAAKDPKTGQPVENGLRNLLVTETALTTALNMSFFAERVGMFGIVMGIALLLTGDNLSDDHGRPGGESFLDGGAASLADEKMTFRHELRHFGSPTADVELPSILGCKDRELTGETVIAPDSNREAHLFESEQTSCNLGRQIPTGVDYVQDTPASTSRRNGADSSEARKYPRNWKTEDPYFLDRNTRLREDFCGKIVGHQKEVAVRAMPNRIDGERVSDDCHQCERTFEPFSEKVVKQMITARICGDDN